MITLRPHSFVCSKCALEPVFHQGVKYELGKNPLEIEETWGVIYSVVSYILFISYINTQVQDKIHDSRWAG